jgi:hypothetical protein
LEQVGSQLHVAPDFACYIKVCGNCAFTEWYSKFLIDDFQAAHEAVGQFGVITETPGGQYMVSIFREYVHHGSHATDFTVMLDSEQWFQLSLTLPNLSDDQVVRAVLYGPYLRAWHERIGQVPADLGRNLRALITQHLAAQAASNAG